VKRGKKEPSKRFIRKEKLQETITTFLNREDNSTVLVGKKKSDAVRINETEHQQKILNDYTHNLHEKFRMENPEIRVSRATFYNVRPKYLFSQTLPQGEHAFAPATRT
jgi:ABC-type Fe3+-citrate transport system substrate-binding protein